MTECNETLVATMLESPEDVVVGMGLSALAGAPGRLTAVVGSCVGVTLYCPQLQLGMLSHVVLPQSKGRTAYPAKYADTAVAHMRQVLEGRGARLGRLAAKVVGGACMFGEGTFMRVGETNVQAAVCALQSAGIRIVALDTGGVMGRRISFDLTTGGVTVESVGLGPRII
jgi:chemotaxis protein CheD